MKRKRYKQRDGAKTIFPSLTNLKASVHALPWVNDYVIKTNRCSPDKSYRSLILQLKSAIQIN